MTKFEVGDVVQLKSGGPRMTVESTDYDISGGEDGTVDVRYFDEKGELHSDTVCSEVLVRAKE